MGEFDGIRALVTGGASGIGLAAARLLADRGAAVACLDRTVTDGSGAVEGDARLLPVRADVTDDAAESADVFRAPVADLLDPANRGVTVIRRDGQEWRGPGFLVGEHLVWGFTGMLLSRLFDELGWAEPWNDARELPLDAAGDTGR